MTQHRWQTSDGFEVLAGWDRPLQHYFLQISRKCVGCQGSGETETGAECFNCSGRGEQFVFDNLDAYDHDKTATDPMGGMNVAQVRQALNKHLTAWPPKFMDSVALDALNNVGNQTYSYDPVGEVKR